MTYVALALSLACAILVWLWQRARREVERLREAVAQQQEIITADEGTIASLEDAIHVQRTRADQLIAELGRCSDADVVALSRRLLLDPYGGGARAVPCRPPAPVGGGGE